MLAFNVAFLASDKRRTSSKVSALANLRSPYMLTFENVCQRKRRMTDMKILILLKHRLPRSLLFKQVCVCVCVCARAYLRSDHIYSLTHSLTHSLSRARAVSLPPTKPGDFLEVEEWDGVGPLPVAQVHTISLSLSLSLLDICMHACIHDSAQQSHVCVCVCVSGVYHSV